MQKKKLWIVILVCSVPIIILGIVLAVLVTRNKGVEAYRLIKIDSFEGVVEVSRPSVDEDIEIFEGQRLVSEDEVTTQSNSLVALLLDSDKHILAEENTKFSIQATGDEQAGMVTINLEYGNGLFEIDNALPDGQSFEVETPNAVCSVRGTIFRVIYDLQTQITTVVVMDGVVHVEEKKNGTEVDVSAGETVTVSETDGIRSEEGTTSEEVSETEEMTTPVNKLGEPDIDLSTVEVGSLVTYGTYESNGETKNLAWDVLYRDEEKVLLITHDLIATGPYDLNGGGTWETSTLRQELNSTYYDEFFTDSEKAYIMETSIDNPPLDEYFSEYHPNGAGFDDDAKPNTVDKLFLLSWKELEEYYGITRDGYGYPYFETIGTATTDSGEACLWWIRSNTLVSGDAPVVNEYWSLGFDVSSNSNGIRPAMYVSLP